MDRLYAGLVEYNWQATYNLKCVSLHETAYMKEEKYISV